MVLGIIQVQQNEESEDCCTAALHAVADLPLVNIRADVLHRLHGGTPLVCLGQLDGCLFGVFLSAPRMKESYLHLFPRR